MRCLPAVFILLAMGCSPSETPSVERDAFIPGTPGADAVVSFDGGVVDDSGTPDGDVGVVRLDGGVVDGAVDAAVRPPLGELLWPSRSCVAQVERCAPSNYSVRLAGEFTCVAEDECWADGALGLEVTDTACGTPGNVIHRLELEATEWLQPGQIYGYKLITQSPGAEPRWIIDERAEYRTMQDGCLNSGLRLPDCEARPQVAVISSTRPSWDTFKLDAQIYAAAGGAGINEITVMLDGEPIDGYSLSDGGLMSLQLDGLGEGKHRIELQVSDSDGLDSAPVTLPFWVEQTPFDWRDGPLYLLFIDRFANGAPDNDSPLGGLDPSVEWQGGDLQGAQQALEAGYFESLGVKTIWLSPVNAQVDSAMSGRVSDAMIAPYHGYWPVRARAVEPRFGGNSALKSFVKAAHDRGLRVLLDLINNQVHQQHEYVLSNPDWFRQGCVCGIGEGCGWSERPFDCLFAPYLPDIDWTNPEAQARFIDDAIYWVEEFDVDGFRVDAVKHVEPMAVFNLRAELKRRFEQGGERIVMLGETAVSAGDRYQGLCGVEYPDGYAWIEGYTGPRALDGQFDFPTYHRMGGFLRGEGSLRDVEAAIADSEMNYSSDALHVQFLGSHDTPRIISRASRDPGAECRLEGECGSPLPEPVEDANVYARTRIAWALLYTTRTIPLLYYGDEIALPGANDPDNRRSLNWGGRIGEGLPDSLTELQRENLQFMESLGQLRARHPALQRGDRTTIRVDDNLLVYRRQAGSDVALVFLNLSEAQDVLISGEENQGFEVLLGDGALTPTPEGIRVRLSGQSAVVVGTTLP